MTTSISSAAASSVEGAEAPSLQSAETTTHRVPHTLPSRFVFLGLCIAIVLSALAFGTNHNWALAIFNIGALSIVILWLADAWKLGSLRISRNPLQPPLLGMLVVGLVQLLPLRSPTTLDVLSVPAVESLSMDPYATRLILAQVVSLFVYFAATLFFVDTPHRLRLLVRQLPFVLCWRFLDNHRSPHQGSTGEELSQSTAFGPFIIVIISPIHGNDHRASLGMLFAGSVERDKRFAYVFAVVLMGVALILTNSRGGVISLVAEILFLVVVSGFRRHKHRETQEKPQRIKKAALRTAMALGLIVALFAGVVLLGGESALSRFVGTVNSEDPTTGRAHFWDVTLDIIKANPIVGIGLGAFPTVYTRYDSRNGTFRLEQCSTIPAVFLTRELLASHWTCFL